MSSGIHCTKQDEVFSSFVGNYPNFYREYLHFHLSKLEHEHDDLPYSLLGDFPPDFEAKLRPEHAKPFDSNRAFFFRAPDWNEISIPYNYEIAFCNFVFVLIIEQV